MAAQELFDMELHEEGAAEEEVGDDAIDMEAVVSIGRTGNGY